MRTLRDEALRIGYHYKPGYGTFMDEYGSYRVVEGLLNVTNAKAVAICTLDQQLHVGWHGDHVKLILPPEEKKPLGAKVAIDTAMALVREHAARADRYEKALVEIAAERTEGSGFAFWMKRRAKEALDGTDTE